MHEIKLAQKIIQEAKKQGASKSIYLEIGELSAIEPEEIEETIKSLIKWEIKTTIKEGKIKCPCSYEGAPKILEKGHEYCLFICPKCENRGPLVTEGGEIKLIGVE